MRINSIHLSEPCLFKETALNLLRNAELDGERAKDASRLIRALENSIPYLRIWCRKHRCCANFWDNLLTKPT